MSINKQNQKGRFIVLDGPDGAGKSTQLELLKKRLDQEGVAYLALREPGGTSVGESIRAILLDRKFKKLTPMAETFLFQAARTQLIKEVIKPALDQGTWILCDRFTLSTLVYQGYAGEVDPQAIVTMSELATEGLVPDLYLVLWIPSEVGEGRRKGRGTADRMEDKGGTFLKEVSDSYRRLASLSRDEYKLINADRSIEEVQEAIWEKVRTCLPSPGTR